MSVKPLFIYTLSLALGIGAVTHAKTLLIEQGPQEVAQIEGLDYVISQEIEQWHRWNP
ncbi:MULTISPECIES: hypothetical protein [unclassified Synechococcus]|uniref:hypothetical protein n=1 Tax=unclassified Synechococcus TaxID=2626047 RepID=UPI0039B0BF8A